MNKTFTKVWSAKHGAFVAVAETARRRGKMGSGLVGALLSTLVLGGVNAQSLSAGALPTGGQVTAGAAVIQQSGATLSVDQSSQRAAINWQSFNVGRDASVQFNVPNSAAVTLNRVVGNERSVIDGAIRSNGNVWVLNSAGVLFNRSANVEVGGLVASTLNLSDADFMAGKSTFAANGARDSIVNMGNLKSSNGGYIALLGQQVSNQGVITANMGSAMLAAGDRISLNFDGNALVGLTVDRGTLDALVENRQAIYAHGGKVHLTTQAVNTILNGMVNNTGVIEAQGIGTGKNGEIVLFAHGGTVQVGGTLKADGGFIETSGKEFAIQPDATIKTGQWLIDPDNITVNGTLATAIGSALNSGDVTLQTTGACVGVTCSGSSGAGDITVSSAITKSSGAKTKLTLAADRDISVNASISGSSGSPLDIVLASRYNGATLGGVYVGADIKTYGGDLTIGGGDINASGFAVTHSATPYGDNKAGVFIGQAILDATGDASGTANNTMPSATSGGNITIRGKGDLVNAHQFNAGVYFYIRRTIGLVTGGNGSISVEGWGGKASGSFWNVGAVGVLWESSNTYIKANNGDVSITGYQGTVADRYGIVSGNTFIGTNGYLAIGGDSYLLRGGTVSINVGGAGGDITAPLIGVDNNYTLAKTGSGVLNISGNAKAWHDSPPSGTTNTQTIGTFSDTTNTVNLVNLTRQEALYAFSTIPTTVNSVTQSQAVPLNPPSGGGGGGGGGGSPTTSVGYTFPTLTQTYTYNGSAYSLSSLWSSTDLFGSSYSSWTPGTDYTFQYNGGTVTGFTNAGTYSGISVNILKSGFAAATSGNTNGGFTIAPKTIGLSAAKVYDGGTSLSSSQVSITGTVGNETLTFSGATSNSKNVGTGNFISAITLGNGSNGGLASNYQLPTLNAANAPASISAKTITVSGTSVANKTYDGTTTATLSGGQLQGVVTGDSVTLVESGTFANKNVGTGKTVTAANSLTGGDAGNYSITQPTGLSANIAPKALTVTGTTVANKTYDGTTSATLSGGQLQGVVTGDDVTLAEFGEFSDTAAGVGKTISTSSQLRGAGASNYSITQPSGLTANITIAYGSGVDQAQTTVQSVVNQPPAAATVVIPKDAAPRANGESVRAPVSNVIAPPARVETSLGRGDNLLLVSTPRAQEPTALVTLSDAKNMLTPAGTTNSGSGSGTGAAGTNAAEVRVPISRNSLADIVNGGVKLPDGVEQQLFVVKN